MCAVLSAISSCSSPPEKPDVCEPVNMDAAMTERLSGLKVRNPQGEDVELTSLWADRRVVLVFLRHFG